MNKTNFPSMKCLPPSSIELLGGGEFFHLCTWFGGWHMYATADVWRSEDNSEAESISFLPCCALQVHGLRAGGWIPPSVSHLATGNTVVTDAWHSLRIFMFPRIQLKHSGLHWWHASTWWHASPRRHANPLSFTAAVCFVSSVLCIIQTCKWSQENISTAQVLAWKHLNRCSFHISFPSTVP